MIVDDTVMEVIVFVQEKIAQVCHDHPDVDLKLLQSEIIKSLANSLRID